MLRWSCAALIVLTGLSLPLGAQEVNGPSGGPPTIGRVKGELQGNKLRLILTETQMVPVTREREVFKDGRAFREVYTTFQPVSQQVLLVVDGQNVRVQHRNGKDYTAKELAKLIDRQTSVVIFNTGKADPFYLEVIRDEVPVILRNVNFRGGAPGADPLPVPQRSPGEK